MTQVRTSNPRSRWNTSQRAVATLLLTLLPSNALFAAPSADAQTAPAPRTRTAAVSAVTPREVALFGPKKFVRTRLEGVYTLASHSRWATSPYRCASSREPHGLPVSSAPSNQRCDVISIGLHFNVDRSPHSSRLSLIPPPGSEVVVTVSSNHFVFHAHVFGTNLEHRTGPGRDAPLPRPRHTARRDCSDLLHPNDRLNRPRPSSISAAQGIDDDVDPLALHSTSDEASADSGDASSRAGAYFQGSISDLAQSNGRSRHFRVDLVSPSIRSQIRRLPAIGQSQSPSHSYQDETASIAVPQSHAERDGSVPVQQNCVGVLAGGRWGCFCRGTEPLRRDRRSRWQRAQRRSLHVD